MESYREFAEKLKLRLGEFEEETLSYNEEEFWMIQSEYDFIDYYAKKHRLMNTAVALPLARGLHDGAHRKATLLRKDKTYRLPYFIHPLQVCRVLIKLNLQLSDEEKDILFAAALCHDMIEDIEFPEHGKELVSKYHLDQKVYDTVLLVSKRPDFTEEEEKQHFQSIAENKLALLIKLSDRCNNVEDMYNRTSWKVHEYVGETKKYFFPMAWYGETHYPDVRPSISILSDKMHTLTEAAEYLVYQYDAQEEELKNRVEQLYFENEQLRKKWHECLKKHLGNEVE